MGPLAGGARELPFAQYDEIAAEEPLVFYCEEGTLVSSGVFTGTDRARITPEGLSCWDDDHDDTSFSLDGRAWAMTEHGMRTDTATLWVGRTDAPRDGRPVPVPYDSTVMAIEQEDSGGFRVLLALRTEVAVVRTCFVCGYCRSTAVVDDEVWRFMWSNKWVHE